MKSSNDKPSPLHKKLRILKTTEICIRVILADLDRYLPFIFFKVRRSR